MEICDGIHRIEAPLGNRYVAIYLVIGDDRSLLVDTGVADSIHGTLLPYLESIGHPIERISHVVSTHCDFDHVGGNAALQAVAPHSTFAAGVEDVALIEDVDQMIKERYGEFAADHGFDDTEDTKAFIRSVTATVPVGMALNGGEEIDLGGRSVEIVHVPGHSPGHVAVADHQAGTVMIGDAVLYDSVLTADGGLAFPPTYRDVEPYRATIELLQGRDYHTLATAHYPLYYGYEVDRFLQHSLDFTDKVQRCVTEVVAAADQPLTLMDMVRATHRHLGAWDDAAANYLVYPLLGHLELLERSSVVRRQRTARGLRAWTVT